MSKKIQPNPTLNAKVRTDKNRLRIDRQLALGSDAELMQARALLARAASCVEGVVKARSIRGEAALRIVDGNYRNAQRRINPRTLEKRIEKLALIDDESRVGRVETLAINSVLAQKETTTSIDRRHGTVVTWLAFAEVPSEELPFDDVDLAMESFGVLRDEAFVPRILLGEFHSARTSRHGAIADSVMEHLDQSLPKTVDLAPLISENSVD